jgi:hypothetical protein
MSHDQDNFGGLILGLRTGYRYSIYKDNWTSSVGNETLGLPGHANRGFYITLSIGGSRFQKD